MTTKARRRTISTRGTDLGRACTYTLTLRFERPSRFAGAAQLRFVARFLGNTRMTSARSEPVRARVRAAARDQDGRALGRG